MTIQSPSRKATVTLLRCRTYIYRDVQYYLGVSQPVDEAIAHELEGLVDEVKDVEGGSVMKPMFKVEYDKAAPRIGGAKSTAKPTAKLQTSATRPGGLQIKPRKQV